MRASDQQEKAKPLANVLIHIYAYGSRRNIHAPAAIPDLYFVPQQLKSGIAFVDGYSLMNYEKAFARMNNTIFNTIFIGVTTLIVIVLFAILIAYLVVRRKSFLNNAIDTVSMLPYIIPGSVVGIALIVSFKSGWLTLTGTPRS